MADRKTEFDSRVVYSRPGVVEEYAAAAYLPGVEQFLFGKYLRPGLRILDLGVGGGRTCAVLSENAAEYIGIDYAPKMVESCRQRFPHLRFEERDAADLSVFADDHFDLVVFSFNGLSNLYPDESRNKCLLECWRVLKPGGIFIFSLNHARSLFSRPHWSASLAGMRPLAGSLWRSGKRFVLRIRQKFFWSGSGYLFNATHGGMLVYLATPDIVSRALHRIGFKVLEIVGDDYPAKNIACMTRWYYYAAGK